MKPVVADKHDFECRDKPKVKTFLEFSIYQDSDTRKKIDDLTCQQYSTKFKFSPETKMEDAKPIVI